MEKFILLGASRGLGWQTYLQLAKKNERQFLLSSRKIHDKKAEVSSGTFLLEQDFSKVPVSAEFLQQLRQFSPTCLIYFAGGGPYGLFQDKKWSDHMWSLQTSFLYPAELLHQIMRDVQNWPQLKTIALIGSSIAEAQGDPKAASYAAAKHALKGLVDSVNTEQKTAPQVLLFSPGYMQTDLLPPNSEPRSSHRAENPVVVAERLIEYIENSLRKV